MAGLLSSQSDILTVAVVGMSVICYCSVALRASVSVEVEACSGFLLRTSRGMIHLVGVLVNGTQMHQSTQTDKKGLGLVTIVMHHR